MRGISKRPTNDRRNMLALESNMPARAFEKAAQHETEHFGIRNYTLVPDLEQNLGQLICKALILDMLDPQALRGSSRFGGVRQGIVCWENDRFFQMVSMVAGAYWRPSSK